MAESISSLDNSGSGRIDSRNKAKTKSSSEGWPCSLKERIPDKEIGVGVRSFAIAKDSSTGKEMECRLLRRTRHHQKTLQEELPVA